ncbi:guanylate kinase [Eubacterium sp. am_0171]|uniref:Guanylate kinase n=1 Tax=Faecalicatena contorta TaxID=39482 RepID=A0A174AFW1_9FIRM|nr:MULTISPECIES: guanylate kinase [Clostridia]MSC83598.1 guanylate kinase [Eubacterium sp. BIOML-A1]MSD04691.1 guanylate kinase [Eubacterium sp. BIOML-A2]RYT25867.1 guanylate kinase [Eubacterium sp. am_0171]CUN87284.1 Guanylate kinase [[Eubacterium] contortum] [Faecalicatena contorta]
MGKICYIMGKSSSGKDTIFKKLKEILPQFRTIILYTTRPIRAGETDGVEYYFTDEAKLESLEKQGAVIEMRAYHTKCGVWKYFTADDGQIDLEKYDYIVIGTLQSYEEMRLYFGKDRLVPVYIEVEDGERLSRALMREQQQSEPKYSEMCRRFLADQEDFSEENLENAGIIRRFQNNNMEECIQEIQMYLEREMDEG